MIYCLDPDEVIHINFSIVGVGLHALTGRAELESALARPLHTGFGQLLYPTVLQRAGALLHGLVHGHPFLEGNKRTAWVSSVIYLETFGVRLHQHVSDLEVADFVEAVAKRELDEGDATMWFSSRLA